MNINIRKETPKDHIDVENLVKEAFKDLAISDQTEHLLVKRLRNSAAFIPDLSLIAEYNGNIIGHILLTKIQIKNNSIITESLCLAPVSVLPNHQRKGVGAQLIKDAHKRAILHGFQSVLLVGHETYYPKFGYKPASQFGIRFSFEAPDENCMALELVPGALTKVKGMVIFPKTFFE